MILERDCIIIIIKLLYDNYPDLLYIAEFFNFIPPITSGLLLTNSNYCLPACVCFPVSFLAAWTIIPKFVELPEWCWAEPLSFAWQPRICRKVSLLIFAIITHHRKSSLCHATCSVVLSYSTFLHVPIYVWFRNSSSVHGCACVCV